MFCSRAAHRLPSSSSRMTWSRGRGPAVHHRPRHDHARVQKPHWQAMVLAEASCIGCSGAAVGGKALDGPDLVASAMTASVVQVSPPCLEMDDAGAALRSVATTWVPVSAGLSRSSWTRRVRGSILAFYGDCRSRSGNLGHQHSLELHCRISAAQALKSFSKAIIMGPSRQWQPGSHPLGTWPDTTCASRSGIRAQY